jgi:hypothetical protein
MPLHSRLQLAIAIRKRSAIGTRIDGRVSALARRTSTSPGHARTVFKRALQHAPGQKQAAQSSGRWLAGSLCLSRFDDPLARKGADASVSSGPA